MKRLTLIRHAKSDWGDPDLSDFDRPLNKRGNKAAPVMGQRMRAAEVLPELIVSSPALRAQTTAGLLARELDYAEDAIILRQEIYEASLETLIDLPLEFPEYEHIALIGHNPGMSELAGWLCSEAGAWMPTCAVIDLHLKVDRWDELRPDCTQRYHYDYPKKQI